MPREASPAFVRTILPLLTVPAVTGILDGTGAITVIASLPIPYKATLEKITYVVGTTHVGGGGTQAFRVRKGGATGTIIATLTLAIADVGAVGAFKTASVAAADDESARFVDGDTLSFTRDSGGTAYSAGTGHFFLTFRQRPQAKQ
jgi:hypothetical protein